jgi:uncharacterized protein GlcG (DUF336 family)
MASRKRKMRIPLLVATTLGAISTFASHAGVAQVAKSGYTLPLSLAIEAATELIRSCEARGYAVSASVVDTAGVIKLQAKGNHSTIHTEDTSFRKAYTVVSVGSTQWSSVGSGTHSSLHSRVTRAGLVISS